MLETEEKEFEEYFLDNITLDIDKQKKESALDRIIRETKEARRNTPPSRYMKGEDFTYSFKKLY
jgi:hypothetical protein